MLYNLSLGLKLCLSISVGVLGIIFNSWVVNVTIKDWRKGIRLSPSDETLCLMAVINLLLQSALSTDMLMIQTKSYETFDSFHLILLGVMICLASCNLWFTTWLSTYYCLKIVHFSKGIFLFLKMRISDFLPRLLVTSAIQSFCLAIFSDWNIYTENIAVITRNLARQSTEEKKHLVVRNHYLIVALLDAILPLILTLIPTGVTLTSLWRHTRRLKKNELNSSRPQTQAHVTAARTMILLVTLHAALYGACVSILLKFFNVTEIDMFLCWYFVSFYPILQSIVIRTGNPKLWNACKKLVSQASTMCKLITKDFDANTESKQPQHPNN